MKSIKKMSLVALAAILSIGFATAQVGVKAGYSRVGTDSSLNGFHIGATYNLPIQGPISLDYGVLYNFATAKSEAGKIASGTTTFHDIDIPVRVMGKFPVASGISAFVYGGPNFSIGLAHNSVGKVAGTKISAYDIKDYSRFNLQLGVGAGLQYNNIALTGGYDWGMLNLMKDVKNTKVNGMKVGLVYYF